MIPLPALSLPSKLLIALAIAASLWAHGFFKGSQIEYDRQQSESLTVLVKAQKKADAVAEKVTVVAEKYETTRAHSTAKKAELIIKAAEHEQTLPDPVECRIAPERVRAINDAFGAAQADPGQPQDPVRSTPSPKEREPR